MPIQQMLLGAGAGATKTYVDDVFSTYVYTGSTSAQTFNNGIDLANEGGMVWSKYRTSSSPGIMFDTERGKTKFLRTTEQEAEGTSSTAITSFNSNGFSVGANDGWTNWGPSNTFASWSFRKSPMFDVVTYTGNGTAGKTISHNLGCIPGMMIVKRTDGSGHWIVYHKDIGTSYLALNETWSTGGDSYWNGTHPTSTQFTVSALSHVNTSGAEYVCYLFAGGESTAATASSVEFDRISGDDDYLSLASSSDFAFGTGDFTIEFWVKPHSTSGAGQLFDFRTDGGSANQTGKSNLLLKIRDEVVFKGNNNTPDIGVPHSRNPVNPNTWSHIALVRNSSTTTLYVNGIAGNSASDTNNYTDATLLIGKSSQSSYPNYLNGEISNFRVVKGTAVYTSSFRPPTEPLTNITNTKLLCCNSSSSATGSTVTPGTITANSAGNGPYADTDSPFDDPANFVFGEGGDQNVIKTGSWTGSGSAGLEVNVGFEPQWIIFKRTDDSASWYVLDVMRGIISGGDDRILTANTTSAEWDSSYIDVTPTGFKLQTSHPLGNGDGNTYIYMAIRRPDGYVGKPPELGTDVLSLTYGSNNTNPSYVTNFPVDWAFSRRPASTEDWYTAARLIQGKYLKLNSTDTETSHSGQMFDYSNGWHTQTANLTDYFSWSWKRHAGFDVVTYDGNAVSGRQLPHGLSKSPEMMWVKKRSSSSDGNWSVYHKGMNGGTDPEDYYMNLNGNDAEVDNSYRWADTAPNSTHFTLGTSGSVNDSGQTYIAMLFASVNKISKVGYYTGDGTNNGSHEITCGFTPRFLIIKCVTSGVSFLHWRVWDSLMDLDGSGTESYLKLNSAGAKVDNYDYIDTTATGFKFNTDFGPVNGSGNKMVYYAHA